MSAASNYAVESVQRSSANYLFAPSKADNVPTAVVCAPVTVTVATGAGGQTAIPVSAFSAGSGVYLLNCNGNGNNDIQAFGTVIITPANTIQTVVGFTAFNVSPVGVVAGAVNTNPYQGVFLDGLNITLFQNVTASVVYSVQAIKIANV
jgi:hypothetical protein